MTDTKKTRSPTRLSGVTALIANGRWAIKDSALQDIITGYNAYLRGRQATADMVEQFTASRAARTAAAQEADQQSPSVMVIPLHGAIFPRGSLMTEMCGAIDAHSFAQRVRAAAQDPNIASIILDMDTPGGAVGGLDVAAAAVREAAAAKKTTAVCNTMMCSAGYWIGAQASEIVITEAGEIGSIGVIATHTDETASLDEAGLKVTYVRSAERKALGQSAEAMDGPVLAQWQSEVSRLADKFVAAVAEGRGITLTTAKGFATGDVFFGQEAVDVGLADRVGTLDMVVAEHIQAAEQSLSPSVRQGRRSAVQEEHVKIEIKDRTGATKTLDTQAETAQADAQAMATGLETAAYEAGIQAQRELVAGALGMEVKDLSADSLAELKAQAADGRAYRESLEAEVEQLAVAVYGTDHQASIDRHVRLAKRADVADLQGMVEDLKAQKGGVFSAGRKSLSEPDASAPAAGQERTAKKPSLLNGI